MHRSDTENPHGQAVADVSGDHGGHAPRSDGEAAVFNLEPGPFTAGHCDDFTEQDLKVFEVSDDEWWVGADQEAVRAACLAAWGGTDLDYWPDYSANSVCFDAVNLDTFMVNIDEDGDPAGPRTSARELVREMLAGCADIPCFFAGRDF